METHEQGARCLDAFQPPLVRQFDLLANSPGGVRRLRELILALAVQGRLVAQDPGDESVDLLLARLTAECSKSRPLRRKGPDLERPANDEVTKTLPTSWKAVPLAAISVKLTDGSHNPPRDAGSGVPMLSSQNVLDNGAIDFTTPSRYVSAEDFQRENARTSASPGDVLLTIVGSLGRSAVVPVEAPDFVLQRSVAVIRTGLVSGYLAIFLRSPVARAYYDEHGKGTAQKGIYLGKLGELLLPVPPLDEQARIVARVDELMRLCDALEAKGRLEAEQHACLLRALLGTLADSATPEELASNWQRVADHFDLLLDRPEAVDALEQTILELAVRGLLVPQDPNDAPASVLLAGISAGRHLSKVPSRLAGLEHADAPYELPRQWAWARLGDLVENMGSGWSPACEEGERTDPTRWAVLRTTAVQVMEYRPNEHKAIPLKLAPRPEIEVKRGDVLVTRAGPMNRVGISCWVDETPSRLMLSDKIVRFHPVSDEVTPAFLVVAMNAGWTRALLEAAKTGMAASQVNVSQADLKSLWIPICSRHEQVRIVTRIDELRHLCVALRQRLAAWHTSQSHLADALVESVAP